MVQRKPPVPTTYSRCVPLPPSTPTWHYQKAKILGSLSCQEVCGPNRLFCHSLALKFCLFVSKIGDWAWWHPRFLSWPLQKLLHLKVTWRKSQSQYLRMLCFLQTTTSSLSKFHHIPESWSLRGQGLKWPSAVILWHPLELLVFVSERSWFEGSNGSLVGP